MSTDEYTIFEFMIYHALYNASTFYMLSKNRFYSKTIRLSVTQPIIKIKGNNII